MNHHPADSGAGVIEPGVAEYVVISHDEESGRISFSRCVARNGLHSFAQIATQNQSAMFSASLRADIAHGLEVPGESVVDADTITEDPEVFPPVAAGDTDLLPFTVFGHNESSFLLSVEHVEAKSSMGAFAAAASNNPDDSFVAVVPGYIQVGKGLCELPGEGLVCAETVLEQRDVFGKAEKLLVSQVAANEPAPRRRMGMR